MKAPLFFAGSGRDAVILAVDDVEENLRLLGELLTQNRYDVLFASNGAAALERVAARMPDVILLDLMMPGMDGIEVCRRLKANPVTQDIPIIFLTAATDADVAVRALTEGAVDYVTKPFHAQELLARVETHVVLKRTRDGMQRLVDDKSDLVAAVAHDLKNPIGSIRFAALALQTKQVAQGLPEAELVDTIVSACNDLLALIDDRLARRAHDAQLAELSVTLVDLAEVVRVVEKRNRPAAHAKGIVLDSRFAAGAPTVASCDYHAAARVLDNLVSNAIKFSPRDARVEILLKATQPAGKLRIEVVDQGPGFTADDRLNLFKPFHRLSAKPTAGETSTGLGLSIARDLITQMQGEIGCTPNDAGGACLWIELPLPKAAVYR